MGATYESNTTYAIPNGNFSFTHTTGGAQNYLLVFLYTMRQNPTCSVTYGGISLTSICSYYTTTPTGTTFFVFGLANPARGANSLACVLSSYSNGYVYALNMKLAYDLSTDYGHLTAVINEYTGPAGYISIPACIEGITWCFGHTHSSNGGSGFTWTGGTELIDDGAYGAWYKYPTSNANESAGYPTSGQSGVLAGITIRGATPGGSPAAITPFMTH